MSYHVRWISLQCVTDVTVSKTTTVSVCVCCQSVCQLVYTTLLLYLIVIVVVVVVVVVAGAGYSALLSSSVTQSDQLSHVHRHLLNIKSQLSTISTISTSAASAVSGTAAGSGGGGGSQSDDRLLLHTVSVRQSDSSTL